MKTDTMNTHIRGNIMTLHWYVAMLTNIMYNGPKHSLIWCFWKSTDQQGFPSKIMESKNAQNSCKTKQNIHTDTHRK